MKKIFITALIILLPFGAKVYSENILEDSESSSSKTILDILEQNDDDEPNAFDILNGTISGRTKIARTDNNSGSTRSAGVVARSMSSIPVVPAVAGYYSESILQLEISVKDIFTIEIINKNTGETIKRLIVNTNRTSEVSIDTKKWTAGDYIVRLRGWSFVDDHNYTSKFSVK